MKNKKKIIVTIAGIILILGGIVIFCIPIFFQTKNSIANDEKLDYINELIEKNQKALAENKSAEQKKNEADINSIWDKFYKVDKARTREYGGSGIGLSIVKAIMESHNEEYGVTNHSTGVEFWFELTVD